MLLDTPCRLQTTGPQCLPVLQHQLSNSSVFRQFVDQPDKLLSVLQHDQILAEAAANDPDVAALLDPDTLKQALAVLHGNSHYQQQQQQLCIPAPVVPAKALMQLQNYAMQLQQTKAAGVGPAQQHQQQQYQHQHVQAASDSTCDQQGAADAAVVSAVDNPLWSAMQQRLLKLQQRSSILGAVPTGKHLLF